MTNIDVETRQDNVEGRLESVTFLLGKDKLTCFIDEDSTFDWQVFKMYSDHIKNLQSIIIYGGILLYKNFTKELSCQKELIDDLDQAARQSSIGSELEELADVERDMVFLEHVLDTQRDTFDHLFDNKSFVEKLNNNQLIYDIRLYNRQVNKLVHVYRDLLETVGDLFSDIMSNRLNALMKVLNSLAIIIRFLPWSGVCGGLIPRDSFLWTIHKAH